MKIAVLLFGACFLLAGGAVDAPSAGYSRAADGTIVRVSGIAGAFVTSATDQAGSVAASFSGRLGAIKLPSSVRIVDSEGAIVRESNAPEGTALFGFNPQGDSVIACYAGDSSLAIFSSGEWSRLPFDAPSGSVMAVALQDSETALVLVQRDEISLVAVRISDGATVSETVLGSGKGPALLMPDRTAVFLRGDSLLLIDSNGTEHLVQAESGGVLTLSRMDAEWVHARTDSGRSLAFRLNSRNQIYELPEAPQ